MYTLGKLVGTGQTAQVYEFGEGKIIKLFNKGYSLDAAFREYKNGIAIQNLFFPHPKVYGMIRVNERDGIIYDKVMGKNLLEDLMAHHDLDRSAACMAKEHQKILSLEVDGLMNYKDFLKACIMRSKQSEDKKRKLMIEIEDLPDGKQLCHGDFHPGNIILQADGNATVIDMMNLCHGPALYDIARTFYLMTKTPLPEEVRDIQAFIEMKETFGKAYLEKMGITMEEINLFLPYIEAARKGE